MKIFFLSQIINVKVECNVSLLRNNCAFFTAHKNALFNYLNIKIRIIVKQIIFSIVSTKETETTSVVANTIYRF